MQWKVDFIQPATTSSVIRPRRSSKSLPKAKLALKKDQGHCVVVSCPCDSLQLSESRWNNYIWEVVQQINEMYQKLQSLQPALVNKKGLILLHDHAQLPDNNQCFKSGTNGAVKFCLILHIHLISSADYHFFGHLDNFSQGTCFQNQQEPKNAFQEFIESQKTDFYAVGINLFLIGKN